MLFSFVVLLAFGAVGAQEFSANSTAGMGAGNAAEDLKFSASLGLVPVAVTSASTHGLDMSTAASQDATDCMKSSYSFVVPRGYHSSGSVDTNVCTTLKHAKSSGIAGRDVYMFPCPTCSKSASTQVKELVDHLNADCASAWTGTIWLDIEGTQYWTGGASASKKFYESLVDACKSKSPKCGVYSSSSQWSAIFGSTSYSYGSNLPLWYAHYDGSASFSDFTKFGGWTSPHAKQYEGTCTVCSTGVDKNYAPNYGPTPTPSSGSCDNKGYYCGNDGLGKSANNLYYCSGAGAEPTLHTDCSFTCTTMPKGQDDKCESGTCANVNTGDYCGGDKISGDTHTLYRCESSKPAGAKYCANGCHTASSGQNDYCN